MFDFEVIYSDEGRLISRLGDLAIVKIVSDKITYIAVADYTGNQSDKVIQEARYNF